MLELLVQLVQREQQEPLGLSVCLLLGQQDQPVILEMLEPKAISGQLVQQVQALPVRLVQQDRRAQRVLLVHRVTPEPQSLAQQERLELQVQPGLLVPQVSQGSPLLVQPAHKVSQVTQAP